MIKVSIIMAVYNAEEFLFEAIESVLNQSHKNFEFIIIDDGSTDQSLKVINIFKDPRIILIKNSKNMGLIYSLNKGLSLAKGKYIFRMDADDICKIKKLEKQINCMEENPDIDVLGTASSSLINKKIKKNKIILGEKNIQATLLFNNCITHPTVVMRRKSLEKYNLSYNFEYKGCEDYAFWCENMFRLKIKNLSEDLFYYRIVQKGVTQSLNKKKDEKYEVISKIHKKLLSKFWQNVSEKDLKLHFKISENQFENIEIEELVEYFDKLLKYNTVYDYLSLKKVLGKKWIKFCIINKKVYMNKYLYYGIIKVGEEICQYLGIKFYL